jgi:hypothetical protein
VVILKRFGGHAFGRKRVVGVWKIGKFESHWETSCLELGRLGLNKALMVLTSRCMSQFGRIRQCFPTCASGL